MAIIDGSAVCFPVGSPQHLPKVSKKNNTTSSPSNSIMSLRSRTALDFLLWMRDNDFEFRSGFSHLSMETVILRYTEEIRSEETTRQRSADNDCTTDTGREDQDHPRD
jgi:hypothetical protein